MSIYTLDYSIFLNEYLPPDKRATIQKSWLGALLAPQQVLHDDVFITYYPDVIARSKQNGQKLIMEDVLNTTFEVVGPPFIYIDNTGDDKDDVTFYNEGEGYPPVYFYNDDELEDPIYFFNSDEIAENAIFKVYVPSAVYLSVGEARISTEVERLRVYGTTYEIISY